MLVAKKRILMIFSECSRLRFSQVYFGSLWPDEPQKDGIGSDSGWLGSRGVCAVRGSLSDAAGDLCDLSVRSLRDNGVRAADISGEPARHRGLLRSAAPTVVPLRHPWNGQALQSGLREHPAGLARVCRSDGRSDA